MSHESVREYMMAAGIAPDKAAAFVDAMKDDPISHVKIAAEDMCHPNLSDLLEEMGPIEDEPERIVYDSMTKCPRCVRHGRKRCNNVSNTPVQKRSADEGMDTENECQECLYVWTTRN